MKVINWVKKKYKLIQLERVALAAVMVTQAIKRVAQSEIGLIVLDIIPLPWANLAARILGVSRKVNEVLPEVVKSIVVSRQILDEVSASNHKLAFKVLIDHISTYSKADMNEFLKFMSMEILRAKSNDGIIDDQERSELLEKAYHFLFKK